MFIAMGLSAVFPVFHGLALYGYEAMTGLIGLHWLVLQGALYIIGGVLYAVCPVHYLIFSRSSSTILVRSWLTCYADSRA